MQDVPNRAYTLGLFIENVESELQMKDNHTWTPAERQYVPYFPNTYTNWWIRVYREVSPTSKIRAEVFFFFFAPSWECCDSHEDRINYVLEAVTLTNNPGSLELSRGHRRGKTIMATIAEGAPGLLDIHHVSNV